MLDAEQIARTAAALGLELATQHGQWMRAEGGTDGGVVGMQILARRRQWQHHPGLLPRGQVGEQRRRHLDTGHRPASAVAMPGQAAQGAAIGQQFTRPGIEPGAVAEVGDIGEGPLAPGALDAPSILLAEPAHQAQAQTNGQGPLLVWLQRAIPFAVANVQRAHVDAVTARVL
ncbi:hypothetical protein D3C85_601560 [compost metagenome]